ncbi:NAD(P)H-hydrate dehydratase [Yoonia sediminilitoris]|uniref:Bifunctional NAD(P)H-hydrate repair enzyme n=1 Tax=Yoonia sediminilitoris TaxID=1286148 RepID=A0A2T6KDM4_9RHOB|nr:NAD(P)H-hydrate dehydratase [Yoonia sediminilitoris]PUB13155.1 hydroxyethylthiazole kinase-like uncharacterized protein yjeF/hydroxyethylthiazole kinase-like uncharacterized protein yjeF [Yoonia sediminilitoris]RCW94490.1 hydroxyethylthiazole kinase-like uncharacterized protein yjeF/hydroxyethylthiazole kinase-like uncharacterized protein yjeF [Yoonia sediminilitoris]
MTELLTAAQMRAIEHAAIDSGEVTGLELMEHAGQGVFQAIFAQWPELAQDGGQPPHPRDISGHKKLSRRAVVLCGPGNNGGDGFVVARLLAQAGWAVDVFLYGDADKLPPDARVNYERWGRAEPLTDAAMASVCGASLVVDALFGTGLSRPLRGLGRILRDLCDCVDAGAGLHLADRVQQDAPPVVAVDMPSGLCADSGRSLQDDPSDVAAVQRGGSAAMAAADLTVTFHRAKLGHYLDQGPRHCGRIVIADIGLRRDCKRATTVRLVEKCIGLGKRQGHKYSHGHAFILSGGVGKGGAARLAARGALRVGAGAVTVGCPPAALIENAAQLNAVMLQPLKDTEALAEILADSRVNALCAGPGLGVGDREAALLAQTLRAAPRGLVLDADALTILAREEALFAGLLPDCILTPHAGEFARLFPDIAERLAAPANSGPAFSKVEATRAAAARAGCVVLFKGPDTVIADPSGRCSVNASVYARAAPWLATAGSGDVLAGFITGLVARGYGPHEAAETGAWLHTECALRFGPGLIAEDLPDVLPEVLRKQGT